MNKQPTFSNYKEELQLAFADIGHPIQQFHITLSKTYFYVYKFDTISEIVLERVLKNNQYNEVLVYKIRCYVADLDNEYQLEIIIHHPTEIKDHIPAFKQYIEYLKTL